MFGKAKLKSIGWILLAGMLLAVIHGCESIPKNGEIVLKWRTGNPTPQDSNQAKTPQNIPGPQAPDQFQVFREPS